MDDNTEHKSRGYVIHVKSASLAKIFTGAARRYNDECLEQIEDTIRAEQPDSVLLRGRLDLLCLNANMTPALEAKLKELPCVEKVDPEFKPNNGVINRAREFVRYMIY